MKLDNKPQHVWLDFDRTLFDTDRAKPVMREAVRRAFGIASDELREGRSQHYIFPIDSRPDIYIYPMFQHLHHDYGIPPSEAKRAIAQHFNGDEFLYEGARGIVQHLGDAGISASILTRGEEEYQRFKIDSCPSIGARRIDCVAGSKAEFIAKSVIGNQTTVIVDDLAVDELPVSCLQIRIDRTAEVSKVKLANARGMVVPDLQTALALIEAGI